MKNKLIKTILVGIAMICSLTGCNNDKCNCNIDDVDQINELLNNNETMNMKLANAVAVIPFAHINGPRNEWAFYAIVNFQYKAYNYVKYQVTYLSCTCRSAEVNYWQTAYVEMTIPGEGKTADESILRCLSFDEDGTGHYLGGFWGDSNPILDEATEEPIVIYDREIADEKNVDLPAIKQDFIPLLIGKTKADFDKWSTTDDMADIKIENKNINDVFAGASVSTNNIIRIIKALFEYHAETFCNN